MIDKAILADIVADDVSAISVSYPVVQQMAKELLALRTLAENTFRCIEDNFYHIEACPCAICNAVAAYRAEYPKEEA
jgi:hypothetical protein